MVFLTRRSLEAGILVSFAILAVACAGFFCRNDGEGFTLLREDLRHNASSTRTLCISKRQNQNSDKNRT